MWRKRVSICPTQYNRKLNVLSASLNIAFPSSSFLDSEVLVLCIDAPYNISVNW